MFSWKCTVFTFENFVSLVNYFGVQKPKTDQIFIYLLMFKRDGQNDLRGEHLFQVIREESRILILIL